MSEESCPVCGAELWCTLPGGEVVYDCGKSASTPCPNAERLAIERAVEILILENNYQVAGEQEAAARDELRRMKNAEHITAEIETYGGQPVLILSAYDMPINWRPGDIVRITLETPLTNAGKSESTMKEE